MEDREFFDKLYQLWVKTTHAEDRYWDYQSNLGCDTFVLNAVGQDGEKTFVGAVYTDADADFITAVHGCFGDLVRRLNAALDEADRADFDRDSRECRIAELEMELGYLKSDLEGLING